MSKKWKREDITPEVLRQLIHLDEETGKLYWKERDGKWFDNEWQKDKWNRSYSGSKVSVFDRKNDGHLSVSVMRMPFSLGRVIHYLKGGGDIPDGMFIFRGRVSHRFGGRNGEVFYGVRFHIVGKYEVRFSSRVIGYFKDPIDAAKAYDKAAFEKYGKYARLNFPKEYGIEEEFEEAPEGYDA